MRPFRYLWLVLSMPALLLGAIVVWILTTPDEPETPRNEASAVTAPKVDLGSALEKSGVEKLRTKRVRGGAQVETTKTPSELAASLRKVVPEGVDVTVRGNEVRLESGNSVRKIEVKPLITSDSGAGLVEADEEPAEPDSKEEEPAAAPPRTKTIALILDDVGFEGQPLEAAAALDVPISFAVIPNTENASRAANLLNGRGFEILCHLPMEPYGYPKVGPGAGAILLSMSDEEIQRRTLENLRSIPHARGVNNHMGSRATNDRRVMRNVLEAVRSEGVFFVDSKTSAGSVGAKVARELNVKTTSRDVFLDDDESEKAVRAQVARLAAVAEREGVAVGIGHVYPTTIRVLQEVIPQLVAKGFRFVPVSQVVN